MGITQTYNKSLAEKWSVRFRTKHPDGDHYDGVVTHIKPTFVVLREMIDFEFGGVIILPRRAVKSVRDGKFESCRNRILHHNGAIRKMRVPRWLDACETIPQVLSALMRRDIWPSIETVFDQGTRSAFYVGPITEVTVDECLINCYDAAGKWESIYHLGYDEIFKIEFDGKYEKHFTAYMKSQLKS